MTVNHELIYVCNYDVFFKSINFSCFATRDTKLIKYYHQDNDYYVKRIPYWKLCFFQYKLYDNEFKFEKIFYLKKKILSWSGTCCPINTL